MNDSDKGRVKKYYGLRMKAGDPGYDRHTPGGPSSHTGGVKATHRTEKGTLERNYIKDTVISGNGLLKRLRDLNQPSDKTEYVAQAILDQLGDSHSAKFYHLVAAKISEPEVRRSLSEIKVDGARNPARVFTYRMNMYAKERLNKI